MCRGDFSGGTAAAFDGAVHVALPGDTGVLACEKQPSTWLREPAAKRRVERGIEYRVAAARPGIGFPPKLPPGVQRYLIGPEPVQRANDSRDAVFRHNIGGGIAGRSPGEQRENRRSTRLFFVAVPQRS